MFDSYVILYPNSNSNPSDNYRVVLFSEWNDHMDNGTTYVSTDFNTLSAALAERDYRNRFSLR